MRAQIQDVDVKIHDVPEDTVYLKTITRLQHRGGISENLNVLVRATNLNGLLETTKTKEIGSIERNKEINVLNNISVDRQGSYRLDSILYKYENRIDMELKKIKGVEDLKPDYTRSTVDFYSFERQPSIEYKIQVNGKPIIEDVFDNLVSLDVDELVVVVGYLKEQIIERYEDEYKGVPITYTHQREQLGLVHALLCAEPHIDDSFIVMLADNIFRGNLEDVVRRQKENRTDAAFLVEEVPIEEASRYGVCNTNQYGEITEVIEKPEDPPTNLVMTGFYTFTPAIFHACHLVQPSNRGEYELPDAIDLLIQSGRTIDDIRLDGWRIDIGYPEDRDRAEQKLEKEKQTID